MGGETHAEEFGEETLGGTATGLNIANPANTVLLLQLDVHHHLFVAGVLP